jgi:hypothetical protein
MSAPHVLDDEIVHRSTHAFPACSARTPSLAGKAIGHERGDIRECPHRSTSGHGREAATSDRAPVVPPT